MQANDVRLLRGSAATAAAAGLVATVLGAAFAGTKGLIGALFGTAVVLAFFSLGQVAIGRISRGNPLMMMNVALLTYIVQILLVGLMLSAFQDTKAFDTKVFAFTILGATLVWAGTQVLIFRKLKIAYVDTDAVEGGR